MKTFMCLVLLLTFAACASKEQKPVASPVVTETEKIDKKNVAYGGNCGMGLCLKKRVKGDTKYGVDYKGKTYLFSSAEARDKFVSNMDRNIELANKHWSALGAESK